MSSPIPGRYHFSNMEELLMFGDVGGRDAVINALSQLPDGTDEVCVSVVKRDGGYETRVEYVEP